MAGATPSNFKTLMDADEINAKVRELGARITRDYQGKDLTVLIVLKGSMIFAADLIRAIDLPLMVEFIGLRSYGSDTKSSGVVQITLDVKHSLNGQNVLIVEDIVDTGLTLDYLRSNLATRGTESIRLASLLHKTSRTVKDVPIEYLGFPIPDEFVVGYGLDYAGEYRNLPCIGVLDPPPE